MRAEADLGIGQRRALGDQDLALDDVDAGDRLGDGVLDLDARVDFDEVELAACRRRPGTRPCRRSRSRRPGRSRRAASQIASRSAGSRFDGRGDLDHLLMPPLHRAIALEQVHQVAVLVAEQLHFDVPRPLDELFEEDVGAAEGGQRLALGLFERGGQFVGLVRRRACRGRRRPWPP